MWIASGNQTWFGGKLSILLVRWFPIELYMRLSHSHVWYPLYPFGQSPFGRVIPWPQNTSTLFLMVISPLHHHSCWVFYGYLMVTAMVSSPTCPTERTPGGSSFRTKRTRWGRRRADSWWINGDSRGISWETKRGKWECLMGTNLKNDDLCLVTVLKKWFTFESFGPISMGKGNISIYDKQLETCSTIFSEKQIPFHVFTDQQPTLFYQHQLWFTGFMVSSAHANGDSWGFQSANIVIYIYIYIYIYMY